MFIDLSKDNYLILQWTITCIFRQFLYIQIGIEFQIRPNSIDCIIQSIDIADSFMIIRVEIEENLIEENHSRILMRYRLTIGSLNNRACRKS